MARTILLIGVGLAFLAPSKPRTLRWKLEDNDVALYDVFELSGTDSDTEFARPVDCLLALYGSLIDPRGEAHFPAHSIEELPYDLALRVPVGKVKPDQKVKSFFRYDTVRTHHPIGVLLTGDIKECTDEVVRFEGTFEGQPAVGSPPPAWPVNWNTTLTGDLSLVFDMKQGVLTSADVRMKAHSVHREDPAREEIPDPVDKDCRFRFKLRGVKAYDPEWAEKSWKLNTPVSTAIDKGVEWLRGEILYDGTYGEFGNSYPHGHTCLAALTLLICEADRKDPFITDLMDRIRSFDIRRTYEISVALMAMEAFYAPANEVSEVHLGRRDVPSRREVSEEDLKWIQVMTDRLLSYARREPTGWGWSYGETEVHVDLSNTQYAALGLLSAWRCGAKIPTEVWTGLARGVLRHQHGTKKIRLTLSSPHQDPRRTSPGRAGSFKFGMTWARGFCYRPGGKDPKGSMTCGGISTLRICRDVLLYEKVPGVQSTIKQLDQAILEGWAWMADNWAIDRHPPDHERHWLLYYLYSLERAGVLCGVEKVNGRDWFFEGANFLVASQHSSGQWVDRSGDLHQTCFALLFLKRGTIPLPRPEATGSGR